MSKVTIVRGGLVGQADSIEEAEIIWRRRMKEVLAKVAGITALARNGDTSMKDAMAFIDEVEAMTRLYHKYSTYIPTEPINVHPE